MINFSLSKLWNNYSFLQWSLHGTVSQVSDVAHWPFVVERIIEPASHKISLFHIPMCSIPYSNWVQVEMSCQGWSESNEPGLIDSESQQSILVLISQIGKQ